MKKASAIILGCLLTISVASTARAASFHSACNTNDGLKAVDAFLVRPLMLPFALGGTALHLALSPLSFLMDVDDQSGKYLAEMPWWFTAGRDLGCFEQSRCDSVKAHTEHVPCGKS
jgi:hypothetical protein